MASVTMIIFTGLFSEDEERLVLNHLNKYRPKEPGFGYIPEKVVAGTKALECSFFIGSFNYLNVDDFKDHLAKLSNHDLDDVARESCQLMIQTDSSSMWVIQRFYFLPKGSFSCPSNCDQGDFCPGGKCDRLGCYHK